jgi:hypothetical protein
MRHIKSLLVLAAVLVGGFAAPAAAQTYCDQTAFYDASTSGATQIVAAPSSANGRIFVCGYVVFTGSTATNVGLVYGTGTNCATNLTKITPAWQLPANGGIAENNPVWVGIRLPAGAALCINTSAGNAVQARVSYLVF